MVNCNPETVSTDYDTSDRLYFEPLDTESVLAICEREKPDGVVIQFGGQTPLKLARAIEDAGYRILGTPFDAVDLAEDRERFAGSAAGARAPLAGVGDRRVARRGRRDRRADRLPGARPALVRPRRPRDARLLHGRRGARDASVRADPRRPLRRARGRGGRRRALRRRRTRTSRRSCSTSRRRASTPATRPASCRRRASASRRRRRSRASCGSSGARSAPSGSSTSSSRSRATARST